MKKKFFVSVIAGVLTFLVLLLYVISPTQQVNLSKSTEHNAEYEKEERPKEELSEAEKAVNKRRLERFFSSKTNLKSGLKSSSYANGKINGTWEQFRFLTYSGSPYGFRTAGSVYDQNNDVLYAISEPGHLWKINREVGNDANTDWEVMNHKENFRASYIDGFNKSDGSFRMVRSSDYYMQYSDDEGRTWTNATGAQSIQKTDEGAVIKTSNGNRVFTLLQTSSSNFQVYVSDDDGAAYSPIATSFNPSSFYVNLFRVYNSESVFLAVYDYSTSKVSIYEHGVDDSNFSLVNTSTNTFVSLDNVFGTFADGNYHFYVATGGTYIYYSSDKGATWSLNQIASESGNTNARDVHPTKPNVIFRGYLDVNVSTNYGASFSNFGHHLGWDVHHMKFYERIDGSHFFFLGKDFGCYISDNPEVWSDYTSLNNKAPAQMCYDADHGQNYYSSFTANQDRGTVGFLNSTNEAETEDVRTTDGLRVTLANKDASVWTWMYFGTIYHKSNFEAGSSGLISINYTDSKWWAAPMIPSPNKNEDAVYLAHGSKLAKLTYNAEQNKIIKTSHYYNFQQATGSEITGFGYSEVNPKRWYVSVKNGGFLYSEDGGQTFNQTTYSGTKPTANDQSYNYTKNQHVIKASKIDEKTVYYAGLGNVFLISNDGGQTFTNHNNGLDIYRIRDFDLSADEKFVYAACAKGGIWVYSVEEDKWFEMNDAAIPTVDFTDVEFIEKENAVSFATFGSGILTFRIDGDYQKIIYPDNLTSELNNNGEVVLQWVDNSDNEDGFIIERTKNGVFTEIGRVAANQQTFTDANILTSYTYQYRVKAFNSTDESYYSNYSLVNIPSSGVVPKSAWTLVSVSSEQVSGYGAALAFDDDVSTMWHTQWGVTPLPSHPHTLVIDMNETHNLKGFGYLGRQDAQWNGTVKDYEFYVSTDNSNWTKVAEGTWAKTREEKIVEFSASHDARYIKLVAKSETDGLSFASCAEISVFTQISAASAPLAPQFIQGGRLTDTQIELIWMDRSNDETGFVVEQFIDGAFTPIYTSGPDETTYNLQNTNKDETYWFRIKAFNDIGDSEYSDTLTIGTESISTGGINDLIKEEGIQVYPNPFNNEINIQYHTDDLFSEWRLLNMSGKIISKGIIPKDQNKITISGGDIIPGVYLVALYGKKGKFLKSVIKR